MSAGSCCWNARIHCSCTFAMAAESAAAADVWPAASSSPVQAVDLQPARTTSRAVLSVILAGISPRMEQPPVGMSLRPADDFLLRWPYGGRVRGRGDLRCHCQRKHQRMEAFPSVVLTVHQPTNLTPVLLLASLDQPLPMLEVAREHSRGNH